MPDLLKDHSSMEDTVKKVGFTVIDFETTGVVDGYENEPWQIGMVAFRDGKVQPEQQFDSLLRIGDRPVSAYAPRHAPPVVRSTCTSTDVDGIVAGNTAMDHRLSTGCS